MCVLPKAKPTGGATAGPDGYSRGQGSTDTGRKAEGSPLGGLRIVPPAPDPFALFGPRVRVNTNTADAGQMGARTGVSDLKIPRL